MTHSNTTTQARGAVGGIDLLSLVVAVVGGALGTTARYALWQRWPESVGVLRSTFVVAVIGCFLLGAVMGVTARGRLPLLRVFAIGACGGFASFSVYAMLGVTFATAWKGVVFVVVTPIVALAAMGVAYYATRPRR